MNTNNDKFDAAVKAFSQGTVPAGPSEELVRQTLERIEQTNTNPLLERIFKMKPFTKIAAAAIVIIGVSAIFLFPTTPGSVALADVYNKVQQAQAYMYKMSMTMSGMGKMMGVEEMDSETKADMTITISQQYGMKMENHMIVQGPNGKTQNMTQLAYLLPEDKVMISIMPEQKTYQRIEFTDNLLEQSKKQNNDPREMIKQMMGCEYTELEKTEIDGITVQGFQTTDPEYTMGVAEEIQATLWVDVNTWMPVKSEIRAKIAGMEISYTIDQFQWNVPVTAADFAYVIPEDYQEQGSMKMPEMTKEAAIEGLALYVKFFGQYPEKIDMASLIPSLIKKMKEMEENPQTEYAKEFVKKMKAAETEGDQKAAQQKAAQQAQQEFTPITALAMFHMKLMQDKRDLAYYGDVVTPDDSDAVLMRWKNDDGTYTVIFGDLKTGEMSYDDMIQLEPQPVEETTP